MKNPDNDTAATLTGVAVQDNARILLRMQSIR